MTSFRAIEDAKHQFSPERTGEETDENHL